ncbi:MAG: Radical SAM superfamily protein [candidate division BRC1 bacterium ADurb.BinA364]|nr:MAG: Radical SAM superfamily protein [candidate division BRC1 bacterium ADurb.BinA364]
MIDQTFRKILFFNPPSGLYRRDDRCQCSVEDQTVNIVFPPIEMAVDAAVALRAGAEARIRDYPAEKKDWSALARDLAEFQPAAAVFFVTTGTLEADLLAARAIKDILGDAALAIAKGEAFEALGVDTLKRWPELDLALFGECEPSLESLIRGEPRHSIPGLAYRDERGEPRITPKPAPIEDLNSLPWPARGLLNNRLYRSPETGNPLTVIHGNRGCPSKCIFCPAGTLSNYTLRLRDSGDVLDEVESCVRDFGIREFLFHGDTFTMNKRWLLSICEGIVERGLKIRWGCNSRVDTIDDERAAAMKRAGCWVVAFGLESGSQEMLDHMRKGAKVERGRQAIAICKRHGLRTHGFFVIGLPWETERTLEQTLRFAREVDTDFFDFNIAYPLPGTELFEIASREGLIDAEGLGEKGYARAAMRTRELNPERLNQWRRKALLHLYMRPGYIARTLWRAGSPRIAANYLRAALRRFRQLAFTR